MKFVHKVFISLALIFLLSACASKPVLVTELGTGALAGTEKIGVIWFAGCYVTECEISKATKGVFIPQGATTLSALAIVRSAHKDVAFAVNTIDVTDIVSEHYLTKLRTNLSALGIQTLVKPDPYLPTTARRSKRPKSVDMAELIKGNRGAEASGSFPKLALQSDYDLTSIAQELGVKHLLVLDITSFGAGRDFGPFVIPISAMYGVASVRLHMVDAESSATLLDDFAYYEIKPENETKNLPKTGQIIAVAEQALTSAITDVMSTVTKAITAVYKR